MPNNYKVIYNTFYQDDVMKEKNKTTKIILIIAIIAISLFALSYITCDIEGQTFTKQGVLSSVSSNGNNIIMVFNDGATITCVERNNADAEEMVLYLEGWIGLEMILEYTFYNDIYSDGYEITSINGI